MLWYCYTTKSWCFHCWIFRICEESHLFKLKLSTGNRFIQEPVVNSILKSSSFWGAEHWYCILHTDVPNEIVSKQDTMTEKRSTSQIQQAELLSTEKPLSDFDLHPFHSLVSSLICTIHHNPSISACWTPRIFQGRSRALNIFKSPIHPRLKSHLWPSISKGLQIYSCTTWIGGTSCDFSSIFGASLVAEIQWLERCADVCWNPWNESFRTRPTVLPFSGFVPTESHGASIKVY
jgi:hypothetical protein